MNIEDLYKSLNDFKNKFDFQIHFTKNKKELKNEINSINNASLDYSIDFLNYQKSYHEMDAENIFDISFFIINKGKLVAYCPLYLIQKEKFELTSNFKFITKPLISNKLEQLNIKNIINYFIDLIYLIKKKLKINKISFISNNLNISGLDYWDKHLLKLNYSTSLTFEQSINLENNNNYIWSNIRKSYKSLINKFKDDIKVNLCDKKNYKIWKNFQNFHLETSKRITRNQNTWNKQFDSINNESAFFFYILDKNNKMIGGSLFDCTDIEANYSVGVYDRNLSELPLGHIILNKSIEFFKKKKIKNINLGEINFNHENLDPKILNIQKFKSGFANKIETKIIYKK